MIRRTGFLILALSAFALACQEPTLPARSIGDIYEFRLSADGPHVMRWPTGSTIRVYLNPGADSANAVLMANAFERAAAIWNSQALFAEYNIVRASSIETSDVVMRWSTDPTPLDVSACVPGFSAGVTTFCFLDPDDPTAGLLPFPPLPPADPDYDGVKMVVSILSSQAPIPGRADALITHELGHVLGIGRHSPFPEDLMTAGTPPRATLSRRDANTIRLLYHTAPEITP
jgi:hypothetical protein